MPCNAISMWIDDLYEPVCTEQELSKFEDTCRHVSWRVFKAGIYSLSKNNCFTKLPTDVIRHVYDVGNVEPTTAAHFERMIFTVASDGVLFARYISVDLRRTKTPRLWNDGYYSDEYPTTEEEDEEVMVDW